MKRTLYVGLDVHKETIAAAGFVAGRSKRAAVEKIIAADELSIRRFFNGLKRRYRVHACYEAGCMGFWLQRMLGGMGVECLIVAPSMLPRKPGDRVKTDRRDARMLALLLRRDEAPSIHIPDEGVEAVRDLLRAREDLRGDLVRQKNRLSKFLLRKNHIYREGQAWTLKHDQWLRKLQFGSAADKAAFDLYYLRVQEVKQHTAQLDSELKEIALSGPYAERVGKLRCLKGVDWLTALNFVVEIGDFRRFRNAGAFMSYLGVVPTEYSSGARRTRGSITKTGNSHLRRLLTESAWHYRHLYRGHSRSLLKRRVGQPPEVIAHADKAIQRLSRRFRHMQTQNKPQHKIVTAIGRELAGFIWSIMVEQAA